MSISKATSKNTAKASSYKIIALLLLLTSCDTFTKKDPLPGKRETYLDFGGLALTADSSLKGKAPSIPTASAIEVFPQSVVNFDKTHTPYKAIIAEKALWVTSIGASSDKERIIFGHPVSDGLRIFISDSYGKISSVQVKDGKVEWSFDSIPEGRSENAACATLAFHEGALYVATAVGEVIALDPIKGAVKWRTFTGAPIRVMPAVKDGRVFITGIDGKTIALDGAKGNILWTHQGFVEVSSIQGGASPVVKDDIVVASYSSGEVYVIKAESGVVLWSDTITTALRSDSIASIPHIVGNPIVENSILYVISHGGRMAAFDLATGLTSWQQDIGSIRSPLLIGQMIYVVDNNNRVVCLEKTTGKIYWVTALPLSSDTKPLVWTAPLAVNEQLVLGASNGNLIFLNLATGMKTKTMTLKDPIVSQPIVVQGHPYLLLESGQLVKH